MMKSELLHAFFKFFKSFVDKYKKLKYNDSKYSGIKHIGYNDMFKIFNKIQSVPHKEENKISGEIKQEIVKYHYYYRKEYVINLIQPVKETVTVAYQHIDEHIRPDNKTEVDII